jgi:hypothetical protein
MMLLLLHCMSQLLAPSDGLPRVTNSVAIGGTADMPRASGAGRSDENDPSATLAVHCGKGFDANFSPYQSTRLRR